MGGTGTGALYRPPIQLERFPGVLTSPIFWRFDVADLHAILLTRPWRRVLLAGTSRRTGFLSWRSRWTLLRHIMPCQLRISAKLYNRNSKVFKRVVTTNSRNY